MKHRMAPMGWGEIRLARKLRRQHTMLELVQMFRERYTAEEIQVSLDYADYIRRRRDERRPKRDRALINERRKERRRQQREALATMDADKRRLIKANDRFASLLRQAGAAEGVVTAPTTKAPRPIHAEVVQFGDSQLAGL